MTGQKYMRVRRGWPSYEGPRRAFLATLIGLIILGGYGVAFAQTDTPTPSVTPVPTLSPTLTPFATVDIPAESTPIFGVVPTLDTSCPMGGPDGWGDITPGPGWLSVCGVCITQIPTATIDWGVLAPSGTPTVGEGTPTSTPNVSATPAPPTFTPSPTVVGHLIDVVNTGFVTDAGGNGGGGIVTEGTFSCDVNTVDYAHCTFSVHYDDPSALADNKGHLVVEIETNLSVRHKFSILDADFVGDAEYLVINQQDVSDITSEPIYTFPHHPTYPDYPTDYYAADPNRTFLFPFTFTAGGISTVDFTGEAFFTTSDDFLTSTPTVAASATAGPTASGDYCARVHTPEEDTPEFPAIANPHYDQKQCIGFVGGGLGDLLCDLATCGEGMTFLGAELVAWLNGLGPLPAFTICVVPVEFFAVNMIGIRVDISALFSFALGAALFVLLTRK